MFNDIGLDNKIPGVSVFSIEVEDNFVEELKKYDKNSIINRENYRNKIDKLCNNIGMIKPIDNEINDVIYFDDYDEVGIVLNKKNISLKQIWTEYRLIYNEKKKDSDVMENSFALDNFDDIFDRLSKKVDGFDKYINDLKKLKNVIDDDNVKLENSKENFEIEKSSFENYRREEIARFEKMEKELTFKLDKVNKLISIFEEKMSYIVEND